jgi:putative methyltransferase (TIGR04325 family)
VVEQENFVSAAKDSLELDNLFFHRITPNENFDLCILSAVLQYLEDPCKVLTNILEENPKFVLISRTAFMKKEGQERITIQEVFPPIYDASYPCRFLDESKIISIFENFSYEIMFAETDGEATPNIKRTRYRQILARKLEV